MWTVRALSHDRIGSRRISWHIEPHSPARPHLYLSTVQHQTNPSAAHGRLDVPRRATAHCAWGSHRIERARHVTFFEHIPPPLRIVHAKQRDPAPWPPPVWGGTRLARSSRRTAVLSATFWGRAASYEPHTRAYWERPTPLSADTVKRTAIGTPAPCPCPTRRRRRWPRLLACAYRPHRRPQPAARRRSHPPWWASSEWPAAETCD